MLERSTPVGGGTPPANLNQTWELRWAELRSGVAGLAQQVEGLVRKGPVAGEGPSSAASGAHTQAWAEWTKEIAQLEARFSELQGWQVTQTQGLQGMEKRLNNAWNLKWDQVEERVESTREVAREVTSLRADMREVRKGLEGTMQEVRERLEKNDKVTAQLGAMHEKVRVLWDKRESERRDHALQADFQECVEEVKEWREWCKQVGTNMEELQRRDRVRGEAVRALSHEVEHLRERNGVLEEQGALMLERVGALEGLVSAGGRVGPPPLMQKGPVSPCRASKGVGCSACVRPP
jgi:chromosome segregation ATPase